LIQFTSGTTGNPKAILMRYSMIPVYREVARAFGHRRDDVPYTGLPLLHKNARGVTVYPWLLGPADHSVVSRWGLLPGIGDCGASRSTRTTSEPKAATNMPANGAGPIDPSSRTRIPDRRSSGLLRPAEVRLSRSAPVGTG
jgi:acyl-CoA synthetase (AMP-forming)/AMP-acid ligase II